MAATIGIRSQDCSWSSLFTYITPFLPSAPASGHATTQGRPILRALQTVLRKLLYRRLEESDGFRARKRRGFCLSLGVTRTAAR
jgi:hypothetical protein